MDSLTVHCGAPKGYQIENWSFAVDLSRCNSIWLFKVASVGFEPVTAWSKTDALDRSANSAN